MDYDKLYPLMLLGTIFIAVFIIFGIIKNDLELIFHALFMYLIISGIMLVCNAVQAKKNKATKLNYLGGVVISFFFPLLCIPYYFFNLVDWFHRIK